MTTVDIIIALLYLITVIGIGVFSAKRNSDRSQQFRANNEISWFPLGISVMISAFSAINFIAFPTEIIKNGPGVLVSLPVFFLVLIPILKWIIPFFRSQKGYSGYAFLEDRFSNSVKNLAVALFALWRLIWIAVTLYASAKMLSVVTGFSLQWMIFITGITALFYSSLGGFRAVVYTDTLQFFTLFGTIIATILFAFSNETISTSAISQWISTHSVSENYFSFDPTIRLTFWSGLLGTFVAFFARYGADQITIQRYMAARSDKEAIRSISLNAVAAVTVLSLLLFWGIIVSIVGEETGKIKLPPIKQMILFISTMPKGVLGLFTAGLLAATMSSIDSGINSMAATVSFKRDHHGVIFTAILGVVAILGAYLLIPIMAKEKSIFALVNKIIHGFGAPLLVLILTGISSWKLNPKAVFWGTLSGALFSVISVFLFKSLAVHYYSVVNAFFTFITIVIFNFIMPRNREL